MVSQVLLHVHIVLLAVTLPVMAPPHALHVLLELFKAHQDLHHATVVPLGPTAVYLDRRRVCSVTAVQHNFFLNPLHALLVQLAVSH